MLAALTCPGSNGISLADPGPASVVIDFPGPLLKKIEKLEGGDTLNKKKALILRAAYKNLPKGFKNETQVRELSHPENYQLSKKAQWSYPAYFSKTFKDLPVEILVKRGYYDYKPDDEIWVDFANYNLGGGVFGRGMVQEEIMALEMPQLADAAAIGRYKTRTDGKKGVMGSNPKPLVLTKVYRTIKLDTKQLYGSKGLEGTPLKELKNYLQPQIPNQRADILAVAVEKLNENNPKQQTSPQTLDDLFNTFVAAFTVAKEANHTTINTGPIGTGAFHNDPKVIYMMQRLAAKQVGVTLRYWAIKDAAQENYERMVTEIINNWKSDDKHSILKLLIYAHDYLISSKNG